MVLGGESCGAALAHAYVPPNLQSLEVLTAWPDFGKVLSESLTIDPEYGSEARTELSV